MGYFTRLYNMVLNPVKTIKEVAPDKGIHDAFIFFLISLSIASVLESVHYFTRELVFLGIAAVIMMIVSGIIAQFLFSAVLHQFIKWFGGKEPYYQTFKAYAYMTAYNVPLFILSMLLTYTNQSMWTMFSILMVIMVVLIAIGLVVLKTITKLDWGPLIGAVILSFVSMILAVFLVGVLVFLLISLMFAQVGMPMM